MNYYTYNFNSLKLINPIALILCFFFTLNLGAQTVIDETIFTKLIGNKYKEVLYETDLDIDGELAEIKAAVGPDQIWDFSEFNYIDSTVIIYEVMVVDPNDPLLENEELASSQYINKITILPGSGGVLDTSTTYLYSSLEDSKWTVNGSFTMIDLDLDGSPDSALQFFTPPFLEIPFPVTSTSEWVDSTALTTVFDGMEFLGSYIIDTTKAQGYGTLITPQGTAEALRMHNKKLTKNPFLPIVDESNDFDFVTAEDMISASIVVEDGRAFYSVKSKVGTSSTFELENINFNVNSVAPNPFDDLFTVKINMVKSGEVEFRLVGVDGKQSSLLHKQYLPSGQQTIDIHNVNIPVGIYFLQVRSGQFLQHVPINKM